MVKAFFTRRGFVFHADSKFLFTAGKMQKLRRPVSIRQRLRSSWKWRSACSLTKWGIGAYAAQAPGHVRWLQSLWPRHFTETCEICRSFKLEVPAHQAKRKAPFVGALTTMVSDCSCYHSATSSVSPELHLIISYLVSRYVPKIVLFFLIYTQRQLF